MFQAVKHHVTLKQNANGENQRLSFPRRFGVMPSSSSVFVEEGTVGTDGGRRNRLWGIPI